MVEAPQWQPVTMELLGLRIHRQQSAGESIILTPLTPLEMALLSI